MPTASQQSGPYRHQRLSALRGESELMRLVARGNHDAFLAVYDGHASAALGVALRMTHNRESAEEIVQETFVNIWRRAGTYSAARGSLRTFVLAIARNRAVDALRRQSARPQRSVRDEGLEERREAAERNDIEVTRRDEAGALRAALERLPQHQSQAIELAFFAGLTHSEIASQLGMPIGTVKGRIRLGIERLRGELSPTDATAKRGRASLDLVQPTF